MKVAYENSPGLSTGIYEFQVEDQLQVLLVTGGGVPAHAEATSWTAPDDHPLIQAYGWFCHLWERADEVPQPRFDVGTEAQTVPAGEEARIRRRSFDRGTWWYDVRVAGRTVTMREAQLAPPDIDDDPRSWIRKTPATARRFSATLSRTKLRDQLSDTVYSFRATRTVFRPYQFRPVIRLLATGRLRLLIADEVGLGKTIEAGLVWTELDARNQANRVLVVCPSMLVSKWRAEMSERFGYDLLELDRVSLDELLDRMETDRVPPRYQAVCSLERLRSWAGLERMAELGPHFDLIVVDEAHAFRNADTRSHALGALIAEWADALVFLSATPLNLGNEDLFNLLSLLSPGEVTDRYVLEQQLAPNAVLNRIGASLFDHAVDNAQRRRWLHTIRDMPFGPAVTSRPEYSDLDSLLAGSPLGPAQVTDARRAIAQLHSLSAIVTRTRKVEVQEHKPVREAVPVPVAWTSTEAEFYVAFDRWQRERARRMGLPVGFVTQMPLRLASTCLPAARDKVLDWKPSNWREDDLDPDLADGDSDYEESDDFPPPPELVDLALKLGDIDTKFDSLVAALLPIINEGKQILLFTFSRAALAYLESRLASQVRMRVLHGDVTGEARHDVMRRFRSHEFDLLAASRVASEGLDFEFCSAVVNYDLPWNPMEVEQRIGRIDRIGQTEEKILVLNFHTPGTIETDIIERIHQRIGVFTDSIGELEPILQSQLSGLRKTIFDFTLSEEQRNLRIEQMLSALEEQRRALHDVENAAAYLASTDRAEIDGLEEDLLRNGRYIGQPELVLLLEDWAKTTAGASISVTPDGKRLMFRGTAQMADQLRGVAVAGERSQFELEALSRLLRDEQTIVLCLDPETARETGEPLLSATHPLTRAALRIPGHVLARYSTVRLRSSIAPAGHYVVLAAVARWRGLRPATELWTATVSLEPSGQDDEHVGAQLLAALAEAQLQEADPADNRALDDALDELERRLRRRQASEEERRLAENEALTTARRISVRETHARKVEQIQRRIQTLRGEGKTSVIHLHEAQLKNQERLLREAEAQLDTAAQGSMDLEYVALAKVEVIPEP